MCEPGARRNDLASRSDEPIVTQAAQGRGEQCKSGRTDVHKPSQVNDDLRLLVQMEERIQVPNEPL
jgi:hypothetical protein